VLIAPAPVDVCCFRAKKKGKKERGKRVERDRGEWEAGDSGMLHLSMKGGGRGPRESRQADVQ